jgi:hypothetical protein
VRRFGISGVALGTAIPLACTSLVFLPRHLCRLLEIPLGSFLTRAYAVPVSACLPFAAVLGLASYEFPVRGYAGVMLQLAGGGVVYCAAVLCALWSKGSRRPASLQAFVQLLEPK